MAKSYWLAVDASIDVQEKKSPAKTPLCDAIAKAFGRKLDFTMLNRSSLRLQVPLYKPIRRIFLVKEIAFRRVAPAPVRRD
jgi:hypothetical protein